jgi:hypothetical protein
LDSTGIELFKYHDRGRWNHLLVEMGYETTLDWRRADLE